MLEFALHTFLLTTFLALTTFAIMIPKFKRKWTTYLQIAIGTTFFTTSIISLIACLACLLLKVFVKFCIV